MKLGSMGYLFMKKRRQKTPAAVPLWDGIGRDLTDGQRDVRQLQLTTVATHYSCNSMVLKRLEV